MTGDTVPWEPGTHPSVTSTHKKTLKEEFTTLVDDLVPFIIEQPTMDRLTTALVRAVTHRLDHIIV